MDGLALIAARAANSRPCRSRILPGYPILSTPSGRCSWGGALLRKAQRWNDLKKPWQRWRAGWKNGGRSGAAAAGAQAGRARKPPPRERGAQNFIIKNALQYIEEHYAEKLTSPMGRERA